MSGLIQAVNVLNLDKQKIKEMPFDISFMAPQAGLEPATLRLTVECSAIELLRIMSLVYNKKNIL